MMRILWTVMVLPWLGGAAPPAADYQYAAAAAELPGDVMPVKALGAWHALMVERALNPDVVDHRDGYALGNWLPRPHVCSGMVRYHGVLAAEKALRFFVVAECFGVGTHMDKAANSLAEELAKRLGPKPVWHDAKVDQVPQRLWEARLWRGNLKPPEPEPVSAPASSSSGK